jgi:hypothetical protein
VSGEILEKYQHRVYKKIQHRTRRNKYGFHNLFEANQTEKKIHIVLFILLEAFENKVSEHYSFLRSKREYQ